MKTFNEWLVVEAKIICLDCGAEEKHLKDFVDNYKYDIFPTSET